MKRYISHYTALKYWDIPFIEFVIPAEEGEGDNIHITFSKHNDRPSYSYRYKSHTCGLDIPKGAVVTRGKKAVSSPELLFLQFANILNIHRLILLGLQLCSHPPGEPAAAITTRLKLTRLLAKTSGHRGHRKAMRAIEYIEDGSASIMESIAFMILTLPHSLGGYGLKGAVFNHEIKLAHEDVVRLKQNRCFVDLFYKSQKLAIEYESFAFHNSPSEQGKDIIRAAILEKQGIDIMRLSTIQLYSRDACRVFAVNVASRLGKRIQIRTDKFNAMHSELRSIMPTYTTNGEKVYIKR